MRQRITVQTHTIAGITYHVSQSINKQASDKASDKQTKVDLNYLLVYQYGQTYKVQSTVIRSILQPTNQPKAGCKPSANYLLFRKGSVQSIVIHDTDKRAKKDFLGDKLRHYTKAGGVLKIRNGKVYEITADNVAEELKRISAFVPQEKAYKPRYLACDPDKENARKYFQSHREHKENCFVAGQKERASKKVAKHGFIRNGKAHEEQNSFVSIWDILNP